MGDPISIQLRRWNIKQDIMERGENATDQTGV
jgi:hypothetical protein